MASKRGGQPQVSGQDCCGVQRATGLSGRILPVSRGRQDCEPRSQLARHSPTHSTAQSRGDCADDKRREMGVGCAEVSQSWRAGLRIKIAIPSTLAHAFSSPVIGTDGSTSICVGGPTSAQISRSALVISASFIDATNLKPRSARLGPSKTNTLVSSVAPISVVGFNSRVQMPPRFVNCFLSARLFI